MNEFTDALNEYLECKKDMEERRAEWEEVVHGGDFNQWNGILRERLDIAKDRLNQLFRNKQ